jgi:hypothetical protein
MRPRLYQTVTIRAQDAARTPSPTRVLRIASPLLRPFNPVLSRQMVMGALLDTRPQVVDATGQQLGITPPPSTPGSPTTSTPRSPPDDR